MPASTDGVPGCTEDPENGPKDEKNDPNGPKDRNSRHEANDQKNDAEDNHGALHFHLTFLPAYVHTKVHSDMRFVETLDGVAWKFRNGIIPEAV